MKLKNVKLHKLVISSINQLLISTVTLHIYTQNGKDVYLLLSQLIKTSKPYGSSFLQQFLQGAIEMKSHDGVGGADELSADEHHGHGGAATQPRQSQLHFLPSRFPIELVNLRARSLLVKQPLDRVAHATRALAKDHYRFLRSHFCYQVHFQRERKKKEI